VAGDPNFASDPDSPQQRVDPNTILSPFAGVGSITAFDENGAGTFLCTATPITSRHILTAATASLIISETSIFSRQMCGSS
jgi:V8-like Glu-specific endopeptidase